MDAHFTPLGTILYGTHLSVVGLPHVILIFTSSPHGFISSSVGQAPAPPCRPSSPPPPSGGRHLNSPPPPSGGRLPATQARPLRPSVAASRAAQARPLCPPVAATQARPLRSLVAATHARPRGGRVAPTLQLARAGRGGAGPRPPRSFGGCGAQARLRWWLARAPPVAAGLRWGALLVLSDAYRRTAADDM